MRQKEGMEGRQGGVGGGEAGEARGGVRVVAGCPCFNPAVITPDCQHDHVHSLPRLPPTRMMDVCVRAALSAGR